MVGLFSFVKSSIRFWSPIFNFPDMVLDQMLHPLVHRNTKENCSQELILPKQSDQTFFLPFTAIEESNYQDILEEACEDIKELEGRPDLKGLGLEEARKKVREAQEFNQKRIGKMKMWFLRLRQTCCHPRAASSTLRHLGGRARTMEEVLEAMLQRHETVIQKNQRSLVSNLIEQGQILE
jgi:E3 ubiquitin-protein ligase SHPRH